MFQHNILGGQLEEDGITMTEGLKGIKLSCQYEEAIYMPAATPRWYQQPTSKTLFWLSKFPQPTSYFVDVPPNPEENGPDDLGVGWGRGPDVQKMLESNFKQFLVSVRVGGLAGPGAGQALMVPRTVVFDVSFFQRTPGDIILEPEPWQIDGASRLRIFCH